MKKLFKTVNRVVCVSITSLAEDYKAGIEAIKREFGGGGDIKVHLEPRQFTNTAELVEHIQGLDNDPQTLPLISTSTCSGIAMLELRNRDITFLIAEHSPDSGAFLRFLMQTHTGTLYEVYNPQTGVIKTATGASN